MGVARPPRGLAPETVKIFRRPKASGWRWGTKEVGVLGERRFFCVACPRGCALVVRVQGGELADVTGHACPRGEVFAREEISCPGRIFSGTVAVRGGVLPVCPVRSRGKVPLARIGELARAVAEVTVEAPVVLGDLLARDVGGTGVDLVATRDLALRSTPTPASEEPQHKRGGTSRNNVVPPHNHGGFRAIARRNPPWLC